MSISLDEFRGRPKRLDTTHIADLKSIAQEMPRAAALTGDPNWDYFLRYLEAGIKRCEKQAEQKRQEAARLVLTDEQAAKAAAVLVTKLEERANTLKEIILIPKWIKDNGESAVAAIAAMEQNA